MKEGYSSRSGNLTISDVARIANVGVATVSRVINGSSKVSPKTASKVKRVLKQTNYRPAYAARALARGQTNTIDLLYNTTAEKLSQDPVLLSILDSVHAEIKRAGYRLAFAAIRTMFEVAPPNLLQALEHRMTDAALIVSAYMTDNALERLRGLPVVLLDHHGRGIISSVTNDNYGASGDAVRLAVEKGHRRIAFIWSGGHDHNEDERFAGYVHQMQKYNVPRRREYEMTYSEIGEQLPKTLALPERPTVLLTTWSTILPEVFQILDRKGLRVPEDISLLSVDSAPGVSPSQTGFVRPVSCHRFDWGAIVRTAMDEILSTIRKQHPVRHIEMPVGFHDQGTLTPPRS